MNDPAYFCDNLHLYTFVLFSFILSDSDLSSYIYDLFDIPVKYLGIFVAKDKMFEPVGDINLADHVM